MSFYWAAKLLHAPRLRHSGSLWRATLVAAPSVLALMIGLSRVADYWHHWEDVMVGGLIGHVTAYGCYRLRFPSVLQSDVALVLRPKHKGKVTPPSTDMDAYPV